MRLCTIWKYSDSKCNVLEISADLYNVRPSKLACVSKMSERCVITKFERLDGFSILLVQKNKRE